jgi:polyhydroxyalkanoate synthase
VLTWHDTQTQPTSDQWFEATPPVPGSWWPVWQAWLANHSSAKQVPPPPMGAAEAGYAPLADAPGDYVLQR